ncbi:MAG: VanZ family protein [Treponema phagedenis]|uniref:VanZ family protein n=1 Tax=Treponema phagedenis TaxID=162 RepID=UPI003133E7AB
MRISCIVCACLIFFLSSQSQLPASSNSVWGMDKLLHIAAFGTFAFTLSFWFKRESWYKKTVKLAVIVIGITALYGLSDEVHQYFVPNRSSSVYDLLADITGACLAVGLRLLLLKRKGL